MALSALEVENYKSFGHLQKIDIRPITILLGKNNAGKSALARLPLLLATGIQTTLPEPLELDTYARGVDVGGSFTDLVHGQSPHGRVRFGMRFEVDGGEPLTVESIVQNVVELRMQIVSHCRLQFGKKREIRLDWNYERAQEKVRKYSVHENNQTYEAKIPFAGLLPARGFSSDLPGSLEDEVDRIAQTARDNFGIVRYLGPFRERPQRLYRMPIRQPSDIGTLGEDAPSMLALDHVRYGGALTAAVNRYLRENLTGWQLSVDASSGSYSLALTPEWDQHQNVNLVDTGTGVAQVLPIFVQRAIDELEQNKSNESRTEIVEQPELHLHPSAHAQLADLYIGASMSNSTRFMIETHSETFILRIRRRIAEGTLDPSRIGIYFVEHEDGESTLRRVGLNSSGEVDYWPEGIFSEDYEETKALADAQIKRQQE